MAFIKATVSKGISFYVKENEVRFDETKSLFKVIYFTLTEVMLLRFRSKLNCTRSRKLWLRDIKYIAVAAPKQSMSTSYKDACRPATKLLMELVTHRINGRNQKGPQIRPFPFHRTSKNKYS